MNKKQKTKMCWNCEGTIPLDDETCPLCGVSVIPAVLEQNSNQFAPSYQNPSQEENTLLRAPYGGEEGQTLPEQENKPSKEPSHDAIDEFRITLLSILFLLTGAVFCIFGVILALFSEDGLFTLQWDASFWFIYPIIAVPMLFFGWKLLKKVSD